MGPPAFFVMIKKFSKILTLRARFSTADHSAGLTLIRVLEIKLFTKIVSPEELYFHFQLSFSSKLLGPWEQAIPIKPELVDLVTYYSKLLTFYKLIKYQLPDPTSLLDGYI